MDECCASIDALMMSKWFFYSQVKARYAGQLNQKLDRDLRKVAELPQPFDALLQAIAEESRLEILPIDFVGRAIQHPLFSMMRWYLKSRGAVCLTTGMTLRKNMGAKYQLERDHIFPYSKLKELSYSDTSYKYSLAQELTNRAILTQIANRTKSATHAEDYLASVKARFPQALELQCIPEDPNLWKIENYELFLEERRKMLASQLNAFLQNITASVVPVVPVSLAEMIAEGESYEFEFKSTLRWDLNEGVVNKKLEEVILKTVAAFANSQGGALLIGVADSGEIIGLEHDYQSLGDVDRDKFELHLRNLLYQQFGTVFVTSKLQIKFPEIENKEVCQVEVSPAKEPIILKLKDKNGQIYEKFYARSGNSSQEIPLSEMNAFIKDRFL